MRENKIQELKDHSDRQPVKAKVLLALLPFWTPQIPPMGLACLKSYLKPHGYDVATVDLNIEEDLRKIYNDYFDSLRSFVSDEKRGNFYNIGHDVLHNHLMAHMHYETDNDYVQLVKQLVFKSYFLEINSEQVSRLNKSVGDFYDWLDNYLMELLAKENPSVLGLSVYRGNVAASVYVFKRTREKYPHIKTVMGGAVFAQGLARGTSDLDFFLEKTRRFIDKVIIGEGEELLLKLLEGELNPSQRVYTLDDINNRLLDLNSVNIPDFSGLHIWKYPNLAAYSARSCPYTCSFCSETVYWGKYRKKKAVQIFSELKSLHKEHGKQLFLMCDSLLNPVIMDLSEECAANDLALYWDGYLRVDKHACDVDTVMKWRRGGFYRARLGVETGSPRLLEEMDKRITVDQTCLALNTLAGAGIKTTTYWIVGYPGETDEDFQMTLDLVERLKDDIYEAECNPFGYYIDGQANSDDWGKNNKAMPLYSDSAREMLLLQTWTMEGEPSRQVRFQRLAHFVQHCSQLGIPNPYSLYDIHKADERWKKLHKNAVPPLIHFNDKTSYIDERDQAKVLNPIADSLEDDGNFGF